MYVINVYAMLFYLSTYISMEYNNESSVYNQKH